MTQVQIDSAVEQLRLMEELLHLTIDDLETAAEQNLPQAQIGLFFTDTPDRERMETEKNIETEKSIKVGEMARLLKQNGIELGEKQLFAWLREHGYVIRSESGQNRPAPKSQELGFLEECVQPYRRASGRESMGYTVHVTPKGQQYFQNLFAWHKDEIHARNAEKRELQRLQKNEKQRIYDRERRAGRQAEKGE